MPGHAATFCNPSTGTNYRLVTSGEEGWRITKSLDDGDRIRLVHLRGLIGDGDVDDAAVARLVAGSGGTTGQPADGIKTFSAVVLVDLERSADVLTVIAREATDVCEVGCRGFRPRSPPLRQQRDAAMVRAVDECRRMADAWMTSNLTTTRPLPGWLAAAMVDHTTARSASA